MNRAFRIAGTSVLCLAPCLAQNGRNDSTTPADAVQDSVRLRALRRDPRALARAVEGRWKEFGRTAPKPEESPAGVREALGALRDGDLPLAISELYRALDVEPDYPPALYELGVLYFRLQRYGDAIVVLERFVAHVPEKVGESRVLGHCYYSLGDYPRAKAHYERVLAVAPREVEAMRGLALSEMRLGNPARALDLLEKVLEQQPEHAEAWTWKARILFDQERSAEALVAARRARDLQPWDPRPWFILGQILLDLGQEQEGTAAQGRYRELNQAAADVHLLEARLRYDPHQLPLLFRLIEVHRSTGNVPSARESLARMLKERPTDVDLRIYALDVLEGLGDADGARLAAQMIEQRCSGEWKAWKRLESYYARTRDRIKQLEAGERYRRMKPD